MNADKTKTVIILGSKISEDDLRDYIEDTQKLTGAKITLASQWVISSDNPIVLAALAALLGNLAAQEPGARGKPRGRHAQKLKLNPAPPREIPSWDVFFPATDKVAERITTTEKNRRLRAGEFQPYTRLHHPEEGYLTVIGKMGEFQALVDPAKMPVELPVEEA